MVRRRGPDLAATASLPRGAGWTVLHSTRGAAPNLRPRGCLGACNKSVTPHFTAPKKAVSAMRAHGRYGDGLVRVGCGDTPSLDSDDGHSRGLGPFDASGATTHTARGHGNPPVPWPALVA